MDKVLETVVEGIEFTFEKDILVKPVQAKAKLSI